MILSPIPFENELKKFLKFKSIISNDELTAFTSSEKKRV